MDEKEIHFREEREEEQLIKVENETLLSTEEGDATTRLTRAINGTANIGDMIKLISNIDGKEIPDPIPGSGKDYFYKENIIADLKNLENLVLNVSEDNVNSMETHRRITEYLVRIPDRYNMKQHTLHLLANINYAIKKFILN